MRGARGLGSRGPGQSERTEKMLCQTKREPHILATVPDLPSKAVGPPLAVPERRTKDEAGSPPRRRPCAPWA